MTDQPTLGEMFAHRRDRLKAAAWRMAVDGHRECGGPPPRRADPDAFVDRLAEARAEHRQPGGQGRWDQMRIKRRSGAQTIRCHPSRRIESCRRRKRLPATSAGAALYCQRHGRRSDHPAHRELPLPSRATVRRAPQPRLHALSCQFRCARRAPQADRPGRSAPRPSPQVHRLRGHLLGYPIAVPHHRKCGKSS